MDFKEEQEKRERNRRIAIYSLVPIFCIGIIMVLVLFYRLPDVKNPVHDNVYYCDDNTTACLEQHCFKMSDKPKVPEGEWWVLRNNESGVRWACPPVNGSIQK